MPRHPAKHPFEEKWKRLADDTRAEAESLPHGRARDAMLKRAHQLETACHVNEWISSPGLRPPVELSKLR